MGKFLEDTITPTYWAESSGYKGGRDPMGIQNSSVVIYTNLLPGITNVTERVRYYGFHCWVLWQYHMLAKSKENNTSEYQVNFIRRSELLIAFLMQSYDEHYGNIPGADFAGTFIDRLREEGHLQFSNGSDSGKTMTDNDGNQRSYWAFSSGAYGQYYFGVLSHFKLVDFEKQTKFHLLEERGRSLAEAFDKSISKENKAKFLSIVLGGKLTYEDLSQIRDFNIQNIPIGSEERKSYIELLISQDSNLKESYQRRDTLFSYLKFAATNELKSDQWLGHYFFLNSDEVDFSKDSASLGWLTYYAQELIHYGEEAIFYALINIMNEDIYHINDFLDLVQSELLTLGISDSLILKDFIDQDTNGPLSILEELKSLIKSKDNKRIIYAGFRLKYLTYKAVVGFLKPIQDYINYNNLGTALRFNPSAKTGIRRGSILDFHHQYQRDSSKLLIDKLMETIQSVLNDHQMIAFKKMGNSDGQVHKFIVEHNHLYPTGQIAPGFTSPRLNSVKEFLRDLSLLDRETNKMTEEGEALLNTLNG